MWGEKWINWKAENKRRKDVEIKQKNNKVEKIISVLYETFQTSYNVPEIFTELIWS